MKRIRLIDRTPRPTISILEAIADHKLFARWFERGDWTAWFSFLAALFALDMTPQQLATYRRCTGRKHAPSSIASEAWLVIGRRGGKSFIMALVAVFIATFHDFRRFLAPGERATVMIIAADRKQARVVVRYVRAMLTEIPLLARLVERETADAFDLSNRVTIEVNTASFRSVRGYSIACAICDEIAFWRVDDDAADPDFEILNALRPAMASIPGSILLAASSPYARRGELYQAHRRHFGKDGDPILVWQADTRTMNPSIPQGVIDAAMERDQASASAEYGAQFRSDIEALLTREAVEACIAPGVRERPRLMKERYFGFVDPSGGSADSMTLAIGHREGDGIILDALRERKPPFSPDDVVQEFSALLKSYGISKVIGDRYAGEWAREPFRKYHIIYDASAKPKSDLYRDLLPAINSKQLDLLDNDRLLNQLVGLERRTARGGRDSIDHAPGGHDDVANALAGVVSLLSKTMSGSYLLSDDFLFGEKPTGPNDWQHFKDNQLELERRRQGHV